ncbi:MAG: hypothetical protein JNL50_15065 [Phycisphaerae bacterium]|nr:hypothetical protein [Phycisphaerae bacterium]
MGHDAEHGLVVDRVFAPGVSVAAWSRALGGWIAGGERGRVLKDDGATRVVAATLAGREVVVKRWTLRGLSKLKATLGAGRGARHWNGAAWLTRHKIATAPCLALAHESAGGARRDYLVMERLRGPSALEVLARGHRRDNRARSGIGGHDGHDGQAGHDGRGGRDRLRGPEDPRHSHAAGSEPPGAIGVREELAIARELGRQVRRMIAHARFNRDHKPSNLVVLSHAGRPSVAVIDCVAILPLSRGGGAGAALERTLASLYIEPLGVGVPPRRSLILSTLRAALWIEPAPGSVSIPARCRAKRRVRALWLAVAARVAAHGDPTPRVHPLA